MGGAGVETAIGASREAGDLAKGLLGDRIAALLEHEGRDRQEPKLARCVAEIVQVLLHGVADEHQRLHLGLAGLARRVGDNLADLGAAAAAIDG